MKVKQLIQILESYDESLDVMIDIPALEDGIHDTTFRIKELYEGSLWNLVVVATQETDV
jgi:hypothetical protein